MAWHWYRWGASREADGESMKVRRRLSQLLTVMCSGPCERAWLCGYSTNGLYVISKVRLPCN